MAPLEQTAPIPARIQYSAIAWLRWRIFLNNFRRNYKGDRKIVSLILVILLRILVWSVMAAVGFGPIVGAGFFANTSIVHHSPADLSLLLAGIFLIWQFFAINGMSIAATLSSFDPSSLIRFPLPFRRYLLIRLLLGWLTPSTIFGCLCMVSITIGLGLADQRLILPSLLVLAVYAALNVLFLRMIGIWVERWLATRRGREIYGIFFALAIIGMQFLNMHYNSETPGRPAIPFLLKYPAPFYHLLPPGLAANSILLTPSHPLMALGNLTVLILYGVVFLAIFAVRLKKQLLGEYVGEDVVRSAPFAKNRRTYAPGRQPFAETSSGSSLLSPAFSACVRKEWIYSHRSARFIALLTPIFFVFILSGRHGLFGLHPGLLLPGAMAYVLFTPLSGFFNIFGEDSAGVQLYLLAPIRLRDVVLAKNAVGAARILLLAILTWIVVLFVAHAPVPIATSISTALWIVFALFLTLTVGNLRSIQAPRRFTPGQARTRNPNQASGWLAVVMSIGAGLLQVPVFLLARRLDQPWLPAILFAILSAAALISYALFLSNSERLILTHRDTFAEELSKSQ